MLKLIMEENEGEACQRNSDSHQMFVEWFIEEDHLLVEDV